MRQWSWMVVLVVGVAVGAGHPEGRADCPGGWRRPRTVVPARRCWGMRVEARHASSRDERLGCLADNPAAEGFNVACYHKDLDPFMARGRELTAQGVTDDKQRDQTRFAEIKAGTLPMPKEARTLYVMTGKSADATGKVEGAYLRWVLYVPFATGESTGLPTRPAGPGAPWLMDPGTGGAHIMISPPRP